MLSGDFEIHPGKYDNFKDEKKKSNKTVSVPQSQKLAGLKTLGLVGLLMSNFLGQFFYVFFLNVVASALKSCIK